MSARVLISVIAGIVLLVTAQALASEPPELRHNPFARPPSEVIAVRSPDTTDNPATDSTLELRATMVGTTGRLANVAGRTLRQGDEVNGFVLEHIHEDHAIFVRNGKRRTVYVKPDQVEDDE